MHERHALLRAHGWAGTTALALPTADFSEEQETGRTEETLHSNEALSCQDDDLVRFAASLPREFAAAGFN